MTDFMRDQPSAAPAVVDRDTFQAELDALRVREKAHTREGDAIAAARRRLPMVEVDGATLLIGERGAVTLLDVFEGRRMLIAYYFMWHTGHPAPEQCEGCTWVTSQVRELSYIHARDVTYATFCQGPYEESVRLPRLHGLGDALVLGPGLARHPLGWTPGGHDAHRLLPATRIQCLRDLLDDDARRRGDGQQLPAPRLTVYGRQETWEDSPTGWPQRWEGKQRMRTDGRPTSQWSRLKAGYSDDLGTSRR